MDLTRYEKVECSPVRERIEDNDDLRKTSAGIYKIISENLKSLHSGFELPTVIDNENNVINKKLQDFLEKEYDRIKRGKKIYLDDVNDVGDDEYELEKLELIQFYRKLYSFIVNGYEVIDYSKRTRERVKKII